MGFRGAYAAGRKQFNVLANTMQKRLGAGTTSETNTTFAGTGALGGAGVGSIKGQNFKSIIPSAGISNIKGTIKTPTINMPKVENPKISKTGTNS